MKNQFGRSMLEMLGVLGLIGLLSIAGIEGYQYAVLRHRSNVVLKMAHQIAADIVNLPRMYASKDENVDSDLDFTNKSGMTLPFAEGNMTATKIDDTVFRVNTPPLDQEQCEAVLKYAENYPLILERTFEEENCIGEEVNRVGLLYFSLDYGANDLNPTPETPPAGCPTLIEPIREECVTHPLLTDDNGCQYYGQAQCKAGTCTRSDEEDGVCSNCDCVAIPPDCDPKPAESECSDYQASSLDENGCPVWEEQCKTGVCTRSDGQDGECRNCACIIENTPSCGLCETFNEDTNQCERKTCPDIEGWTAVAELGDNGEEICCKFEDAPVQCWCMQLDLAKCSTGEYQYTICCDPNDQECMEAHSCHPREYWFSMNKPELNNCIKYQRSSIQRDVDGNVTSVTPVVTVYH